MCIRDRLDRGIGGIEIDREPIELELGEKGRHHALALAVLGQSEDGEAGPLGLEPRQRGHLLDARPAPGGPEIDQHRPTAKIGELFRAAILRGEGKRRCGHCLLYTSRCV